MNTALRSFRDVEAGFRLQALRQGLYDEAWVMMRDVLVNLHGEEHRARRNLETRIFRRDFFRYYETEVFPDTLAQTLAPALAAGRADLVDLGYRIMLNLTADFTGIDRPARTAAETTHLLRHLRAFSKAATLGQTPLPKEPIRAEIAAALAEYDVMFHTPSVRRRQALLVDFAAGRMAEDDLPRDILLVLLRAEGSAQLAPDALLRETAYYLMAGAQSSVHAISHCAHEIFQWCAAHPQDRARLEQDPVFLQRAVHEAIRLRPSSPAAWRSATCPIHLPDGSAVADGAAVTMDILQANRDPAIFGADADRFNPDREIPGGQAPYGVSFGLGMHACLGRNLAVGVPARDPDPAKHHYGVIPLIVGALLQAGIAPDSADAPEMDRESGRPNWGRYPVVLRRA